jgi:hypothetical protein
MELNKHIDFKSIFKDLMEEHDEDLNQYRYESPYYGNILDFYQLGEYEKFDVEVGECEFGEKEITFIFTIDFNDANESDTQGTSAYHLIKYDRVLSEFTYHEYEQG